MSSLLALLVALLLGPPSDPTYVCWAYEDTTWACAPLTHAPLSTTTPVYVGPESTIQAHVDEAAEVNSQREEPNHG